MIKKKNINEGPNVKDIKSFYNDLNEKLQNMKNKFESLKGEYENKKMDIQNYTILFTKCENLYTECYDLYTYIETKIYDINLKLDDMFNVMFNFIINQNDSEDNSNNK